eukprot:Skav207377  [mRNA]  locus=scaffold2496:88341:89957:+ [translate_table: standard]
MAVFSWHQILLLFSVSASSQHCRVLEDLQHLHCYGLDKDEGTPVEAGADACREACCKDEQCQVWQFNPHFACFRGKADLCVAERDGFAAESLGERLRPSRESGGMTWDGPLSNYAELMDVDPAARGPREDFVGGLHGEVYRLRRDGPLLEVDVSCWSPDRHPDWCCPAMSCWGRSNFLKNFCCQTAVSDGWHTEAFSRLTPYLPPSDLEHFSQILPEEKIDEESFHANRRLWALGHHPPLLRYCSCASGIVDGEKVAMDGSTVLWPLVVLLALKGANLTGTFVNLGAGTCMHPDPLYQLLASPEGSGFLGLAVEADSARLQRCQHEMARSFATVVPVPLMLDPIHAADQLRPYVAAMFPQEAPPWPLDILVVDLDGCDCLIAEGLMQILRPKVLTLEIAFHIPPPFRFAAHWDLERSSHWNSEYDIDRFNAASGCSLSYALHKFKHFGYHLLRLTQEDVFLVHESVRSVIESGLGLQLPQDEFLCYRASSLWSMFPSRFVREWFYAPHPSLAFSQIWSNISKVNKEMGRDDAPFTLDF